MECPFNSLYWNRDSDGNHQYFCKHPLSKDRHPYSINYCCMNCPARIVKEERPSVITVANELLEYLKGVPDIHDR